MKKGVPECDPELEITQRVFQKKIFVSLCF